MLADILRTDGHRLRRLAPCSDEIKALRALVRGRDDLVAAARRPRQPAAQPARELLARRRRHLRRHRQPDRARLHPALSHAGQRRPARRKAHEGLHGPAPLFRQTAHIPASCWRACAPPPSAWPAIARPRPRARSSAPWPPSSPPCVAEIAKLTSRIEHAVAELPDGQIVMSFPRAGRICAAQILAELGDVRDRFPDRAPARRRGRRLPRHPRTPAKAAASSSAGPATTACAPPSPASPTTPATASPGPPTSTSAPAPAAATTPTPSASSPAPGSASSGAPGPTAQPMIRPDTKPPNASQPELDTGCLMGDGPEVSLVSS